MNVAFMSFSGLGRMTEIGRSDVRGVRDMRDMRDMRR